MMAHALYAGCFILTLMLQAGVVASLPGPYNLFPLTLVVGIIFLHERSIALGVLWIMLAGLILEVRGLGEGLAFAGLVAGLAAMALAVLVFAKRSFWALMGVGIGTALAYVAARLFWLLALAIFFSEQFSLGQFFDQSLLTIIMTISGVFLFGAYIRRFMRWSRAKFVRKEHVYDISFPQ